MTEIVSPSKLPVNLRKKCFYSISANILLLAAISQIPNESPYFNGMTIKVVATMLTIYAWRYVICSVELSLIKMALAYSALFISILSYIYFCVSFINEPFGEPLSKWIGDPVWIFAIPSTSFLLFDIVKVWCEPFRFLIRSAIELVVVFPLWSSIWLTAQLSFGWAWF